MNRMIIRYLNTSQLPYAAEVRMGSAARPDFIFTSDNNHVFGDCEHSQSSNETLFLGCIELKLRDFSRVIRQANRNRLFCNFSFVAMPIERYTQERLEIAASLGIGILAIEAYSRVRLLSMAAFNEPVAVELQQTAIQAIRRASDEPDYY